MILIDLNQVVLASLHASLGAHAAGKIDPNGFRSMTVKLLRANKMRFRSYGEMVLCSDARDYWRTQVFPYYKASRKENRAKSKLNWASIYECLDAMKEDLQTFFPYKYVQVPMAEADDVIAVLVRNCPGKKLILSGDQDFVQLHNSDVQQYDPVKKTFITSDMSPKEYLFEHVAKGDYGDGVPNIFSPDNALVVKIRQKPITKKVLQELMASGPSPDHPAYAGWLRNTRLIDLTQTPKDIEDAIMKEYEKKPAGNVRTLQKYFVERRMRDQLAHLSEF